MTAGLVKSESGPVETGGLFIQLCFLASFQPRGANAYILEIEQLELSNYVITGKPCPRV